jgi:hypothetical protein
MLPENNFWLLLEIKIRKLNSVEVRPLAAFKFLLGHKHPATQFVNCLYWTGLGKLPGETSLHK